MERPSAHATGGDRTRTLVLAGLPIGSVRTVNLAIAAVVIVMGTLGVLGIASWPLRALAVVLCLAFAGAHLPTHRDTEARRMVLPAQAVLAVGLLLLPSTNFEAFGFLLYLLTVEVAMLSSLWVTVGWAAGFWLCYSIVAVWHGVPDAYVGIIFALGVFPFCALVGHLLRATADARAEGRAALRRLQAAQGRIEELAVTDERNRLARDLHDSVKQQVFATTMQIGAARAVLTEDPAAARSALDEADLSAQKAAAELNLVIEELRPLDLEGNRLVDALRSLGRDWERRTGLLVDVVLEGEERAFPGFDEALLRTTQEAIANSARHGHADRVEVVLTYGTGDLNLQIRDDGAGFAPSTATPGVGLGSMRARVEDRGGRFDLWSAPGAGTRIAIEVAER